jgi:glycosyltransferase A (GT-A) superfamily protein (DUF2064 family)
LREINKIALLVFVRDAKEEARVKPIFKGDDLRNKQLYTYLNKRIISVADKSNLDYFVVSTKDQVGVEFADRFKNAFKSVFELGYDAVISVGNDSPQLNVQTIKEVQDCFSNHDVVIGRTNNKGAYTVGLTKYAFSKCDFDAVNWSSNNVVLSIKQRSIAQGSSYTELEDIFHEINCHDDLRAFIKSVAKCEITFHDILFLVGLFYKRHEKIDHNNSFNQLIVSNSFEIRGSPKLNCV